MVSYLDNRELGDTQEDSYTQDEVLARHRADYVKHHEKQPGIHWSQTKMVYCMYCGEPCRRVRTVIGNESWAERCGVSARSWSLGTQGYVRLIEEKE